MPRVIGVGVIGMGWMGEAHSRSYRQIVERFPECPLHPRLVICADDVEARSSAARVRFGFEKQTTDWRRVIEDPDVEVVIIAAPNNLHLEIVRHAASQGKHISWGFTCGDCAMAQLTTLIGPPALNASASR